VGIAAKKNSHQPHSSPSNSTLGGDKSTLGGDRVLYWSKQIVADIEQKNRQIILLPFHIFKKKKKRKQRIQDIVESGCRLFLPLAPLALHQPVH
jgi:hypothetical protein